MNALSRQTMLAEYMLSAEPQVRSSLTYGEYLYSDRPGIATLEPLTWKPPGDIQNKLLSPNKKAMLMLDETGNVKIYRGNFDNNGNSSQTTQIIFNSTTLLNNGSLIGIANKPYSLGFSKGTGFTPGRASLHLRSLAKDNSSVGLFGEFSGVFNTNNLKLTLTDTGNLDVYNGEQLIWSTNSSGVATDPATPATTGQTPGAPPVAPLATPPAPGIGGPVIGMTKEEYDKLFSQNTGIVGPGTSNPLTPKTESLFSNPLVLVGLAGAAFFAFKSFNK